MPPPVTEETRGPLAAYDPRTETPVARAALTLVPQSATEVTVTDFDEVRAELGVPDLTSASLVRDRVDFWERARRESVMLTEGMLREQDSRLLLDHGFTSDDVDWEARWTGPDGAGWALGFRPDLDMGRVEDAVRAGVRPLADGQVSTSDRTVSLGTTDDPADSWGDLEGVRDLLTDAPAASAYYRIGCVQLADALGPDADVDDLDRVLARHPVDTFEDLEAVSVMFVDGQATARLGRERTDVTPRADLADAFPTLGPIGWQDGFEGGVNDPSTGRIGWEVANPSAAASLVLTDVLPFAVCPDVMPLEEPTGL